MGTTTNTCTRAYKRARLTGAQQQRPLPHQRQQQLSLSQSTKIKTPCFNTVVPLSSLVVSPTHPRPEFHLPVCMRVCVGVSVRVCTSVCVLSVFSVVVCSRVSVCVHPHIADRAPDSHSADTERRLSGCSWCQTRYPSSGGTLPDDKKSSKRTHRDPQQKQETKRVKTKARGLARRARRQSDQTCTQKRGQHL